MTVQKKDSKVVSGVRCEGWGEVGWGSPCDSMNATRRRQNTQYVDDERNYVTLCDDCMKKNEAHWNDVWADYYRDCI